MKLVPHIIDKTREDASTALALGIALRFGHVGGWRSYSDEWQAIKAIWV
jgi:hypothetical protein